jgi:pentatricopeptide repeat protein
MPDVVAYTSIIDALCKAKAMDKAELFLRLMVDNGVRPNTVTYNSMIHGYSSLGQWKGASRMFREMTNQGLIPDTATWNSFKPLTKKKLVQGIPSEPWKNQRS